MFLPCRTIKFSSQVCLRSPLTFCYFLTGREILQLLQERHHSGWCCTDLQGPADPEKKYLGDCWALLKRLWGYDVIVKDEVVCVSCLFREMKWWTHSLCWSCPRLLLGFYCTSASVSDIMGNYILASNPTRRHWIGSAWCVSFNNLLYSVSITIDQHM